MYQVAGIKRVNYVNKKGREVNGVELHLIELADYSSVDEGVAVCSLYAPAEILHGHVCVGSLIDLSYQLNRDQPRLVAVNVKSDGEEV